MNVLSDRAWVVVFGATGFTGRLVCRALRRRNVRFAIAGRSARKLALLSEALGGVEQCVVDLGSSESLRLALDRRLLVCACAGPFVEVGEPVMAAAAELGVHYVDVSGEQAFARLAFERYDAVAKQSGACLVPSMAFESAPADWAASLLVDRLGGELDALDVVYVVRAPEGSHPTASRGSLRSAVATLAGGRSKQHLGGALRVERDGAVVRRFETLRDGSITAASFGGAEAVLVPSHVPVAEVRTFRAAAPLTARALQVAGGLAPWLARAGREAIDRVLSYTSEGPDIVARGATRFEVIVHARRGGAEARAHLTGVDPYEVTAEIQAHAAESALAGYVEAQGVVSPAVGYPALAAVASLAETLRVEVAGDQLAPVRPLRSLRPVHWHARGGRQGSRHSWHTRAAN